jgi:hypothetical protein
MKKVRYYLSYLESFLLDESREPNEEQLDKLDTLWNEMSESEIDFCNNLIADYIHGRYSSEQMREIIKEL